VLLRTVRKRESKRSKKEHLVDDLVKNTVRVAYLTNEGTGDERVYIKEHANADVEVEVRAIIDRMQVAEVEGDDDGHFLVSEEEHNKLV
jgi:L-lactate utilization protein LutC